MSLEAVGVDLIVEQERLEGLKEAELERPLLALAGPVELVVVASMLALVRERVLVELDLAKLQGALLRRPTS